MSTSTSDRGKVLIVDDDPKIIDLLVDLLELEGYEVSTASDGADDYLDLPFRDEELLMKVARLIERHRIQKHYREIVEHAADIIYTRDMDGYITSINNAGA